MKGNMKITKSYRRGVRLGIYFKRIRDLLTKWDRRCVEAAKAFQLPAWLGHVPVYAAMAVGIGILAITLFSLVSSFVLVIGIALFGWLYRTKNISYDSIAPEHKASYERFSWEQEYDKGSYKRYSWEYEDD